MEAWMKAAVAHAAASESHAQAPYPDPVQGRVLHMDGDMLCYWAGGNEDTTVARSRGLVLNKIETMRLYSGSTDVVVHLTADASTKGDRRIVATVKEYQAQRKGSKKPHNWRYLRDWLTESGALPWRVKVWSQREADDGVAACAYASKTGPIAIGTRDKDFRMIPGIHVDWEDHTIVEVPAGTWCIVAKDKVFGDKWFWLQMLHGDGADNIPGLPLFNGKKVGEVTAHHILAEVGSNHEAYLTVRGCYLNNYGDDWADRLVEQAILLWMRTDLQASVRDFLKIMPPDPRLVEAVEKIEQRIKGFYDEAIRLGGIRLPQDQAG